MKSNLDLDPYEHDSADFEAPSVARPRRVACSPSLQGVAGTPHYPVAAYHQVGCTPSVHLAYIVVGLGVPQGVETEALQEGAWTGMELAD